MRGTGNRYCVAAEDDIVKTLNLLSKQRPQDSRLNRSSKTWGNFLSKGLVRGTADGHVTGLLYFDMHSLSKE